MEMTTQSLLLSLRDQMNERDDMISTLQKQIDSLQDQLGNVLASKTQAGTSHPAENNTLPASRNVQPDPAEAMTHVHAQSNDYNIQSVQPGNEAHIQISEPISHFDKCDEENPVYIDDPYWPGYCTLEEMNGASTTVTSNASADYYAAPMDLRLTSKAKDLSVTKENVDSLQDSVRQQTDLETTVTQDSPQADVTHIDQSAVQSPTTQSTGDSDNEIIILKDVNGTTQITTTACLASNPAANAREAGTIHIQTMPVTSQAHKISPDKAHQLTEREIKVQQHLAKACSQRMTNQQSARRTKFKIPLPIETVLQLIQEEAILPVETNCVCDSIPPSVEEKKNSSEPGYFSKLLLNYKETKQNDVSALEPGITSIVTKESDQEVQCLDQMDIVSRIATEIRNKAGDRILNSNNVTADQALKELIHQEVQQLNKSLLEYSKSPQLRQKETMLRNENYYRQLFLKSNQQVNPTNPVTECQTTTAGGNVNKSNAHQVSVPGNFLPSNGKLLPSPTCNSLQNQEGQHIELKRSLQNNSITHLFQTTDQSPTKRQRLLQNNLIIPLPEPSIRTDENANKTTPTTPNPTAAPLLPMQKTVVCNTPEQMKLYHTNAKAVKPNDVDLRTLLQVPVGKQVPEVNTKHFTFSGGCATTELTRSLVNKQPQTTKPGKVLSSILNQSVQPNQISSQNVNSALKEKDMKTVYCKFWQNTSETMIKNILNEKDTPGYKEPLKLTSLIKDDDDNVKNTNDVAETKDKDKESVIMLSTEENSDSQTDTPSDTKEALQCEICGKQFSWIQSLNRHLRKHEGGTRFKCDHCQKNFSSLVVLQKHMQIHTSEFPANPHLMTNVRTHGQKLLCGVCSEAFSYPFELKQHVMLVHRKPNIQCGHCGRSFATCDDVREHIRIHL